MSVETERPTSRLKLGLMWSRMKKASRLDQGGVLGLKTDTAATGQAVAVLVLSALAYGIGYTAQTQFQKHDLSIYGIIVGSLANTVIVCFAAFVWSATAFLVIVIPIPPIVVEGHLPVYWFQGIIAVAAVAWLFLSQVFVLKQVMGLNLRRTILTVAVGLLILAFIGIQFGTA